MTDRFYNEFREAKTHQERRNDALRIRTKIDAARKGDRVQAGRRWPFELLQNAHDPGIRDGLERVNVAFSWDGKDLRVTHNGKVFDAQELAALLSGGSSKDYDDETTTGRFGTGFLVTHGLSTNVDIKGLVRPKAAAIKRFEISLRRGGDVEDIETNIDTVDEEMRGTVAIADPSGEPTVTFVYRDADEDVVVWGLDRLEEALPFLFATCEHLGEVTIDRPGSTRTYRPTKSTETNEGAFFREHHICITCTGIEDRTLTAMRVTASPESRASVLVLLDGEKLVEPPKGFPRVFIQFPIAGTQFLPFQVVIEGRFTPQQERNGILMGEEDRALMEEALSVMPKLALRAVRDGWDGGHRLAYLAAPNRAFSTEPESGELEWWRATIKRVVEQVSREHIVHTTNGWLPAVAADGEQASFVLGQYEVDSPHTVALGEVHALATAVQGMNPVRLNLAADWNEVALEWQKLGISVDRVGLADLVARIKGGCHQLEDLPVNDAPYKWIADVLVAASGLPEQVNLHPMFAGLLPDQRDRLSTPKEVRFDAGISDTVKDISESIAIALRSELLSNELVRFAQERPDAYVLLKKLVQERTTEAEVIERLLKLLEEQLPNEKEIQNGGEAALLASANLIPYLFESQNHALLRRCPLEVRNGTVVRADKTGQYLAPVPAWPDKQQPFAELYLPGRVLSNRYEEDERLRIATEPLLSTGLLLSGILHTGPRATLDGALLERLAPTGGEGVVVRDHSFGQIALLSQHLLQRCADNEELATLLTEFVLCVAAEEDSSWRNTQEVVGTREGQKVTLRVSSALWPAELAVRSWIPVETEDGRSRMPGTPATLRRLYEAEWLRDHPAAVQLLSQEFGFSRLDLLLETMGEGEERRQLEEHLAALAQAGPEIVAGLADADPEMMKEVVAQLEKKRRQAEAKSRNQRFGHAVQNAIALALNEHGLATELVDRGFDYYVTDAGEELDAATFVFSSGGLLLEVKATTTGEVHLTSLQAKTAANEKERFVLCVVDLCHLAGTDMDRDWNREDVTPYARFIQVSGDIEEVYSYVDHFSGAGDDVRLRNEEALRYAVPRQVWENGEGMDKWVTSLKVREAQPATQEPTLMR